MRQSQVAVSAAEGGVNHRQEPNDTGPGLGDKSEEFGFSFVSSRLKAEAK